MNFDLGIIVQLFISLMWRRVECERDVNSLVSYMRSESKDSYSHTEREEVTGAIVKQLPFLGDVEWGKMNEYILPREIGKLKSQYGRSHTLIPMQR